MFAHPRYFTNVVGAAESGAYFLPSSTSLSLKGSRMTRGKSGCILAAASVTRLKKGRQRPSSSCVNAFRGAIRTVALIVN